MERGLCGRRDKLLWIINRECFVETEIEVRVRQDDESQPFGCRVAFSELVLSWSQLEQRKVRSCTKQQERKGCKSLRIRDALIQHFFLLLINSES